MYEVTVKLTCDAPGCDNQVKVKAYNPRYHDAIAEIQDSLKEKGIILGVALCGECIKQSNER
jgi:hypothetical protein